MAAQLPPGTDVWAIPAGTPPAGVIPNLENPETNEKVASVTLSIFIVLVAICLAMRVWVQVKITKQSLQWDDFALLLAFPPQIAYTGITIWMVQNGLGGRHIWETKLGIVLYQLPYWSLVVAALPQPITGLVKIALLLLFHRLFKRNKFVRFGSIVGMVVIGVMYTAWMFVFIFQASFESVTGAHLSWAQASFNLATDVFILTLPITAVMRLQISGRRKLGILAVFATGCAAIVMSCVTVAWRTQNSGADSDPTWDATLRMTVTVIEVDIGFIVACLPLFAPYFQKQTRLLSFGSYFQSIRSRLIGRSSARGTDHSSEPQFGSYGEGEFSQKNASSVEMNSRAASSSVRGERVTRKEWFDATASAAGHHGSQERQSEDARHLVEVA